MTQLEGVNVLLEALGEQFATALETGQQTLAGEAEAYLELENKRIQLQGWFFNTIPEEEFTVAGGGTVTFSPVPLKIKPVAGSSHLKVSIRDGKLFDQELNDDDQWTAGDTITLETVYLVTFDELSQPMADYVAASAAVRFQRYKKRGTTDDALLREAMVRARLHAIREQQDLRNKGILDTAEHRRLLGRDMNVEGHYRG